MNNYAVLILVTLAMMFMACLLGANIIAVKLIDVAGWVLPAGIILYPITFLLTDTISEVFGRRQATFIVWIGFFGNIVLVIAIYVAGVIPSPVFWENHEAYDTMLGAVPRIVVGSMVAYLISQNLDVIGFHFWKRITSGRMLWLRNNASTMVSQSIDTVIFVLIAFAGVVPNSILWEMIWMQYIVKLGIAAIDTPLLYALVPTLKRWVPEEYQAEVIS